MGDEIILQLYDILENVESEGKTPWEAYLFLQEMLELAAEERGAFDCTEEEDSE